MAKRIKKESNTKEDTQITFSVYRVKEMASALNENNYNPELVDYKINYRHHLTYSPVGFVNFSIYVTYFYIGHEEKPLFLIEVQNVFSVEGIGRFIDSERRLDLPIEFLTTIVALSISHTRALLAARTSGTVFQEIVLPVVNPREMAETFFNKEKK